ncbi:elongation factor 4, partial [Candidatus Microgenomates bacterium]|nr:elongation factor 4 [Candidatus Microgenomates bacterium]
LCKKSLLRLFATGTEFSPVDIGYFLPQMAPKDRLMTGEVGYVATGLKDTSLAKTGDTLTDTLDTIQSLPGYKEPKSMVFLSFYPTDNDNFPLLREALEKLHLSDSSFTFELHSSAALGKGYLCGFLGLLHADVLQERLEREFNLNIIASAPTVEYQIELVGNRTKIVHIPEDFPDPSLIKAIKEPLMYVSVFTPKEFVGNIMQLVQEKRGDLVNLEYLGDQAKFTYLMPLSEMIIDFFDKLKSITSGYASLDYEFYEYRKVKAVKLEFLLNKNKVEAFSQIVVFEKAQSIANRTVEKLKDLIPRHQFQIPIQAAIGGKIIARADVKSFRKDVTAKLYGGDQSRKDKLLDAQKKGKKKMRQFGKVEIPQEVFLKLYKE